MSSNDVQASLASLRGKFLIRAREEVRYLSGQADKMQREGLTVAELSEAYQLLHRLAGSAGTFGLPGLGEAARRLEKTLKPRVEQARRSGTPEGESVPPVAAFVDAAGALSQWTHELPPAVTDAVGGARDAGAEGGGQGLQLRVLICHSSAASAEELIQGLAPYGFQCVQVPADSPRLPALIAEASRIPSLALVSEDQLEVLSAQCRRQGIGGRELPLLCMSPADTFEDRYRAATTGAEGFFPEPADFLQLADAIERFFSERKQGVAGRVLIVEDDPELAEHYRLVLGSSGVDVRLVTEPRLLMTVMAEFQPDIVLLDVELDGLSGISLARLIRFEPKWLSLPIIYLSSEDDPENQLHAVSKGADEFLMKPVTDGFLVRSVLHRCFRARQLSELMNRDSLTGLLKHSVIKQEAQREWASCQRLGHQSSVAMVDLDHFKQINDTWGHGCGDRVIKALSNLLKSRLRESDLLGRYGGEEFLVVLPGCDVDQARKVIEGIGRHFAELSFSGGQDQTFRVTLSAGIARLNDFAHSDESVQAADQALYQRKRAGRNGVTVYCGQPASAADQE